MTAGVSNEVCYPLEVAQAIGRVVQTARELVNGRGPDDITRLSGMTAEMGMGLMLERGFAVAAALAALDALSVKQSVEPK